MAYALTLLAVLGLFLWATPARTAIAERLGQANVFTQEIASSSGGSLRKQASRVVKTLRQKSVELLRQQLHDTIDGLVK